jgi:hypothetical protein
MKVALLHKLKLQMHCQSGFQIAIFSISTHTTCLFLNIRTALVVWLYSLRWVLLYRHISINPQHLAQRASNQKQCLAPFLFRTPVNNANMASTRSENWNKVCAWDMSPELFYCTARRPHFPGLNRGAAAEHSICLNGAIVFSLDVYLYTQNWPWRARSRVKKQENIAIMKSHSNRNPPEQRGNKIIWRLPVRVPAFPQNNSTEEERSL